MSVARIGFRFEFKLHFYQNEWLARNAISLGVSVA